MSLSDYSTILKELSANGNGDAGNSGDILKVVHNCVLSLDDKWDLLIQRTAKGIIELGQHIVISLRLVAVATSISLVLWGTSKVITASRTVKSTSQKQLD
jgi:hypothetical protein